MFNFFKNKKVEQQPEPEKTEEAEKNVLACISYYITDEGVTYVDVEMADYDDDSVTLLSSLVGGIHSGLYMEDTLSMLRNGLVKAGKPELYISLVSKLSSVFLSGNSDAESVDEPFIKPSEVLE